MLLWKTLIYHYPLLWSLILFCFGLLIGSFLNVVIYRLPVMLERSWKEQCRLLLKSDIPVPPNEPFNLVAPASCCPQCKSAIAFYDNIPLLSFIALRGRCRTCLYPIHWRYPVVELLSAIVTVFIVHHNGLVLTIIPALLLSYAFILLMWIDIEHYLLPDEITLPLLWLGLLWPIATGMGSLQESVLGAAVGYLTLYSIYWIFKYCTGKEGMGHGDFKLLAMLGAWLGISKILQIIVLASTAGALVGVGLLCTKKLHFGKEMPFGPYLVFAGWIALLYGQQINHWYWQWVGLI